MIAKKLLTTIAFAFVLLFSGCAEDDFVGVDGLCPLVVSTVPEDGDVDVPLNQIITATFNEKMNPATITETSFTVSLNGVNIKGTVSYNGLTATFRPESPLEPNTEYTGTITTMAKDERGNALQENYVWTFTTLPEFTVTIITNPTPGPITTGAGIYIKGTAVTVTAAPYANYTFTNWTTVGGVFVSNSATYTLPPLMGDVNLVANYTINAFTISLLANPTAGGNPLGAGVYNVGTTQTVTANPNAGYTFTNWTEAGVVVPNAGASYTFVLTGNRTLVANYSPNIVLSSNPPAGGSTTGAGTYLAGTTRTVTATANPNYTFSNWTENGVIVPNAGASYTFVLTVPRTLVANFTQQFTIGLSVTPPLSGTTTGAGTFNAGSTRTVTANAEPGFTFSNWTENGVIVPNASASYTFVLTGNRTLVANFISTPYTIVLSENPLLSGTTTGEGTFNAGSTRTVTATPANANYTFSNWTENGIIVLGAGASYTFVLTGNRTLVANFTPTQYTIAVSPNPLIGGSTGGAGTFNAGTTHTVTATPNPLYTFSNWTENNVVVPNAGASYTFVLNGNRTLVANFTLIPVVNQYNVTLSANPNNGGGTSGGGPYNSGATVQVSATPNNGFTFNNWTENNVIVPGAGATYTFVIASDRNLVANFTPDVIIPPANGGLCNPNAVDLGLARNYAILAESAITTTGVTSITGNMGISPLGASSIEGFSLIRSVDGTYSSSILVAGRVYASDYTTPTPTNVGTAVGNMLTAYTTANGMAPNFTEYLDGNFNNVRLNPGVYKFGTGLNLTNTITLDGGGTDCAVFVFQIAGSLTVNPNTKIVLTGGAKADNIYWVVAGAGATLNTDVDFSGTILASKLISLAQRTVVNGRLLAQTAVTLIGNTVVMPSN